MLSFQKLWKTTKDLGEHKMQNDENTSVEEILRQMKESRPLPLGMSEFEEWSDRIISGTLLKADPESQKFALATMLMHLSPTTDHECDGYFIKSLRKSAINQIADAKMRELRDKAKARLAAEEESKKQSGEVTAAPIAEVTNGKTP